MRLVSYAQNFEDLRLWRAFDDVTKGRYLDIGTQDPVRDSVSLLFYERGWRGVNVEPTPRYADAMRIARPDDSVIEAAVSSSVVPLRFFEIPESGLSTGIPEIAERHKEAGWTYRELAVPTVSLYGLFELMGPDPIHWLKIDVEGMEADVIESWGDHPARPAALLIEAIEPTTKVPSHEAWYDKVLSRGYRDVLFDGVSRYFLHEKHAHRAEDLRFSPNVLDGFQVTSEHFSAGLLEIEHKTFREKFETEKDAAFASAVEALEFARSSHAETHAKLDVALREVGELNDQLAATKAEYERARTIAREQLSESLRQLSGATEKIDEIQSSFAEQIRENGRLQGQLAAEAANFHDRLTEASNANRDLRRRLSRAEGALASAIEDANQLRVEMGVQKAQFYADMAMARTGHETEMERAREETYKLAGKLTASEGEIERFRESLAGLNAEIAAAVAERENLGSTLDNVRGELERFRAHAEWREEQLLQAARLHAATHDILSSDARSGGLLKRGRRKRHRAAVIGEHLAAINQWEAEAHLPDLADRSHHPKQPDAQNPSSADETYRNDNVLRSEIEGPINSVPKLIAHQDRQFIRAAYISVLGRPPEAEGEAFYLSMLRSGVHKLQILRQLRRSAEGRTFVPGVAGLDRAIRRHRLATLPLIGFILRFFIGGESDSAVNRQLRIMTNEVSRGREENRALADYLADRLSQSVAASAREQESPATPTEKPELAAVSPEPTPPEIHPEQPVMEPVSSLSGHVDQIHRRLSLSYART